MCCQFGTVLFRFGFVRFVDVLVNIECSPIKSCCAVGDQMHRYTWCPVQPLAAYVPMQNRHDFPRWIMSLLSRNGKTLALHPHRTIVYQAIHCTQSLAHCGGVILSPSTAVVSLEIGFFLKPTRFVSNQSKLYQSMLWKEFDMICLDITEPLRETPKYPFRISPCKSLRTSAQ